MRFHYRGHAIFFGGALLAATTFLISRSIDAGDVAPVAPGWLEVESYMRPWDGGDAALAFERLQASPECGPGCRVQLRCGATYLLLSQLDLCTGIRIEGCAGSDDTARSKFITTTGTNAVAFRYRWFCNKRGIGPGAQGAELSRVTIHERKRPPNPYFRAGILVEAPDVLLERVAVNGFAQGVRIDAGAKRGQASASVRCTTDAECKDHQICEEKVCKSVYASNANLTTMIAVRFKNQDHASVYYTGPDTNAGATIGLSSVSACQRADILGAAPEATQLSWRWPAAAGPCAAVVDQSFLGNTHVAPHVAQSKDLNGNPYQAYFGSNPNNRSLFLGAYQEEDLRASTLGANALAIGGKSAWNGGLNISGRTISGPTLISPTIRSAPLRLDQTTQILKLEVAGTDDWWRLEYDGRINTQGLPTYLQGYGWARMLYRASSSGEVFAIKQGSRR